jgi:hypothetical protein
MVIACVSHPSHSIGAVDKQTDNYPQDQKGAEAHILLFCCTKTPTSSSASSWLSKCSVQKTKLEKIRKKNTDLLCLLVVRVLRIKKKKKKEDTELLLHLLLVKHMLKVERKNKKR